ncbi:MAG TPA: hypothetical protein VJ757_15870 [Pseudonocardiaceae bacterium]|nr:hypothetical protein [Pseudonocardiaceae bacterium]
MTDQRDATRCSRRELAVGWALHTLEPVEESLVAAHLHQCPACSSVAAETQRLGALLALSVPQLMPSAGLEQRILSAAGARRAAPVVPLALSTQLARPITEPSEVDFPGWLSITWADVVGPVGVEQALAVGNSRIG